MNDWLVLVNPHAGTGHRQAARAAKALALHGVQGEVVETPDHAALGWAIDSAARAGRRHFVAVGGDGTVNVVANAILTTEFDDTPVLGVLPGGTGCDLLRTFAISQKMEQAAAHLATETIYPIDVGVVEGEWGARYFVNVGDVGIIAAAAKRAATISPRLGKSRYQLAFGLALPAFKATGVSVKVGKRSYEGEAIAVVFANAQYFGGGFNIAPKAAMMDGALDVQIFTATKRSAGRLVPKVKRGLHLTDRDVMRFTGPRVEIATDAPWPVEVDGEYLGNTPVVAKVATGRIALKI